MVDCADKDQSSKYEMTSILNVTWDDNYYGASRGMTEERCKQGCLEDCNCIVALFKDGECRKQKLPLSYGRWSAEVPDMAFVRVIKSSVNPGQERRELAPFPHPYYWHFTCCSGYLGILYYSRGISDVRCCCFSFRNSTAFRT